jgi:hypothetical protein
VRASPLILKGSELGKGRVRGCVPCSKLRPKRIAAIAVALRLIESAATAAAQILKGSEHQLRNATPATSPISVPSRPSLSRSRWLTLSAVSLAICDLSTARARATRLLGSSLSLPGNLSNRACASALSAGYLSAVFLPLVPSAGASARDASERGYLLAVSSRSYRQLSRAPATCPNMGISRLSLSRSYRRLARAPATRPNVGISPSRSYRQLARAPATRPNVGISRPSLSHSYRPLVRPPATSPNVGSSLVNPLTRG